MSATPRVFAQLGLGQRGQSLVEYAVMLGLILAIVIGTVLLVGRDSSSAPNPVNHIQR